MPVPQSTHSLFWFCGALFIVGAFLAVGGILRKRLDVIDRASRLIAGMGIVLAIGGLGGALAVAFTAPGSTISVFEAMVGQGKVAQVPAPKPKPGAQSVQVTGVDFKFQPSTITVQAGKPVQFVFRNDSSTSPHTFTIASLGLDLKADPGGSDTTTLKHVKPGTYQFICTIPGHAQLGMKGTLTVKS
jgi:plastocyanin